MRNSRDCGKDVAIYEHAYTPLSIESFWRKRMGQCMLRPKKGRRGERAFRICMFGDAISQSSQALPLSVQSPSDWGDISCSS